MATKLKLSIDHNKFAERWQGRTEGGLFFQFCDDMGEKLLGLVPGRKYRITVTDKKPKKWRTSVTLEAEPHTTGNDLYVSKRHLYEEVPLELAQILMAAFFVRKPLKVWIKTKVIDG